jgi:hypothetical protein
MTKIDWRNIEGETREFGEGMVEFSFTSGEETIHIITHESEARRVISTVKNMYLQEETEAETLHRIADQIAASAYPDEDSRLEVAYAIARHLNLHWPAARKENQKRKRLTCAQIKKHFDRHPEGTLCIISFLAGLDAAYEEYLTEPKGESL